jgi:hypothetical protein
MSRRMFDAFKGGSMTRFTMMGPLPLAWLGAWCVGCSAPPGTTTLSEDSTTKAPERPPFDPFAPGTSILCDVKLSPAGSIQPEFYQLSAINHKLRSFPELSAAIGVDSVSDCDSARRFWSGYAEYAWAHPGFDNDQELAPMPEDDSPPPAQEPSGAMETPKIFNGTAEANNPIVQLMFAFSSTPGDPAFNDLRGNFGSCTGTFIAKNWILTAAHCMTFSAIDQCIKAGTNKVDCVPRWEYYAFYTVKGTHSLGRIPYILRNAWSRIYIHPDWIGTKPAQNDHLCPNPATCHDHLLGDQNDVALIYIGDDANLPPSVEENGAKRLSIVPPDPAWPMTMWGYGGPGQPIGPGGEPTGTLRRNLNTLTPNFSVTPTGIIEARIPMSNWSFPCPGDSGGPLFRPRLSINTNVGQRDNVEAIVGIQASGPEICGAPPNPQDPRNVWRWTSVSTPSNRKFILDSLKNWPNKNARLACRERRLLSGSPPVEQGPAVMDECWGAPCSGDTCPTDQFCSRPGRAIAVTPSVCTVCTTFNNGCDCIVGQCLPRGP